METGVILDLVEQQWTFTPEKYPAMVALSEDQSLQFCVTHVLQHQAKNIAWWRAKILGKAATLALPNIGIPVEESEERLRKLLFNCFRLASLTQVPDDELTLTLNHWKTWGNNYSFNPSSYLTPIIDTLTDRLIHFIQSLEPASHLNTSTQEQRIEWQKRSIDLLEKAVLLPNYLSYSRESFEDWLERQPREY